MEQEKINTFIGITTDKCGAVLQNNIGNRLTQELIQGILLHMHNIIIENANALNTPDSLVGKSIKLSD